AGGGNEIVPDARSAARGAFHEAETTLQRLAEELPGDSGQRLMQIALFGRACATSGLLERPDQLITCRKAAILADELVAIDPANISVRIAAISAHHNLAGRLRESGEPEAIDDVRRSAELADQLFSQRPDLTDARRIDATEH